jgi:addiction module RelE/StbE family toxin
MEIKYTARFRKQYQKADKEIKDTFSQALELFLEEPNHQSLRNHPLKEKFVGFRSINITEDWRAVFRETQSRKQKIIIFHMLGTHNQLYK